MNTHLLFSSSYCKYQEKKNVQCVLLKLFQIVSGNRKQFFYDMDSKNEDLNEKRNKRKGTDDNSSDRKKKIHQPAGSFFSLTLSFIYCYYYY